MALEVKNVKALGGPAEFQKMVQGLLDKQADAENASNTVDKKVSDSSQEIKALSKKVDKVSDKVDRVSATLSVTARRVDAAAKAAIGAADSVKLVRKSVDASIKSTTAIEKSTGSILSKMSGIDKSISSINRNKEKENISPVQRGVTQLTNPRVDNTTAISEDDKDTKGPSFATKVKNFFGGNTIIIKKLNVIDNKITRLSESITRIMDKMGLDARENELEKIKGISSDKKDTEDKKEKNPSWLKYLLPFAIPMVIAAVKALLKNGGEIFNSIKDALGMGTGGIGGVVLGTYQAVVRTGKEFGQGIKNLAEGGSWKKVPKPEDMPTRDGKKLRIATESELVDKNGKALKGGAKTMRLQALGAVEATSAEGKILAKETSAATKIMRGAGKITGNVAKISGKVLGTIARLTGLRTVLKSIPALATLIAFIDPLLLLLNSGGQLTPEIVKSFGKAIGGLAGGALGSMLGSALGSIIPIAGTLIGGIAGSFMGAKAGEYIGEKIAELMFGIKTPAQVMAEIAADSIKAVKSAGNSILGAVMHPVDTAKAAVSAVKGAAKAVGGFFSGAGAAVSKWWSGGKTENKGVTPGSAKPKTPAKVSGFDDVKAAIKAHEGEELIPYQDGEGKWTVGVGHLIGDGSDTALAASGYQKHVAITKEKSDALFEEDFAKHVKIAQNSPGWDKANMQGKAAMIDMTYNMGAWWTKFTVAAKLLATGNFAAAAENLRGQQKWRSQVGERVDWVADNMAAGGGTNASPDASPDARASTVKTASVSAGGTASAATPKAPAPKAPGAGGGQPAMASATQSNKYPAPAGAASGAAPQQQASASTRSIPSPTAPHAQEDHYAVHFNAGQSGGGNAPSFI
jgi:GH24 family phage-related lysozyme (muramidase)